MNIVIIAEFSGLKNRPDKLDYLFFEYLKLNSNNNIILCENNPVEIDKNVNDESVLIIFTCDPCLSAYQKNKKIYYIYDLMCMCGHTCDGSSSKCMFRGQYDYIKDNKFDYIWYKYETPITIRLSGEYNFYKFPHMMFNPDIHKEYNLKKKYDICFFGATYPKSYPLRNKLYGILNKLKDNFNILILPYTKKHPEKMITGEDLYKLISQSYLTCACCEINGSLVSKYYEINLCGSIVLGDYPEYETERVIRDNMVYVNLQMSEAEIINKIEDALNNKHLLETYSNNTKSYLNENYMMDNGVKHFDTFFSYYFY
jgi:hypothetical protein